MRRRRRPAQGPVPVIDVTIPRHVNQLPAPDRARETGAHDGRHQGNAAGRVKNLPIHLLVLCMLVVLQLTGSLKTFEKTLDDARFNRFARAATGDVVLVGIDAASIEKIGVWPWPRSIHADLIERLENAGATDIVLDIDFSAPSNPQDDAAFARALEKAGGSIILPTFKQFLGDGQGGGSIHVNRPLPQFAIHTWPAVVNVEVDTDGLVRRYPYGHAFNETYVPSAAALLAGKHIESRAQISLDFSIRPESVPTVSYVDVLRGDATALARLKDRKIIVGGTAIELGDRFNIPNGRVISGAALQALAAETILQNRTLNHASNGLTLAGLGLVMLLIGATWKPLPAGRRVMLLIGLSGAIEFAAVIAQARFAFVLDTAIFHTAILSYLVGLAVDEIHARGMLGDVAENRFQRIAMSLGDGLVCADHDGLITIWNPGAIAIFGYQPDEIIGAPLGRICFDTDVTGKQVALSLLDLPAGALQSPGGKVVELTGRRKNGETFPLEACFSQWQGPDGRQYGAVLRDISGRKREAERIRYLARCDALTGLANRNSLNEYLGTRIAAAREDDSEVALLVMDLDKFKQINDTLGHPFGDRLLCSVANRLTGLAEDSALVARLGGDEFAIVIVGHDCRGRAHALAERICASFDQTPLGLGEHQLSVNASIGSAICPADCETQEELLSNADLALYQAKASGRGRHIPFVQKIRDEFEARLSVESGLARGSENQEFELFYQPQVDLKDGKLVGAEALIRWRHPVHGIVMPSDFMSIANGSAVSQNIALWVMRSACTQGRIWEHKGHSVRIGVNLSPSQLLTEDLAATVETILRDTGLSPSLLELEVTENILLADDDKALDVFERIQDLGVHIAFDDFGTGFASLTYLKKFPFGTLKIDKSFVRELRVNPDDAVIVRSTIGLGKMLGLSVIAEGIEDQATADLLRNMGCEEGQGYVFGRPMPAAEFERKFLSGSSAMPGATAATSAAAANSAAAAA
jgi:diguanylate cyclase (GGDEF)-like protein/PAS domain S-box-containing protein